MSRLSPSIRRSAVVLLLLVATLVAFLPVLRNDFVNLDDHDYVTKNPRVREGLTLGGIRWACAAAYAANWHPLTWASHMLDWEIYGERPWGHHLTSLLLHAANTTLLFLFLERMTRSMGRSAFAAALFGVHPLHVESVAWVAERKDVLSTFFWMLTLCAYLGYVRRPGPRAYFWVATALALGLSAKPMLVTLPLVLMLLDTWPLDRSPLRRDRLLEKAPLLALTAASSLVTLWAQHRGHTIATFDRYPLSVRLANAVVSCVAYLWKTVWPRDLSVFYPHPREALPAWEVAAAAAALALTTAVAVRMRRRFPYVFVGWLWYLVTLVPVIGLVQVGGQAMADRYTYVPLIGIFWIAAWGGREVAQSLGARKAWVIMPAAILVASLVARTRVEVGYWRDSVTLLSRALAVTDENSFAHWSLGAALMEKGRTQEAIDHYQEAIRISPDSAEAHNNLGVALSAQGRLPESIQHYERALSLKPDFARAHGNLGHALEKLGRTEAALEQYEHALRVDPDRPEAYVDAGAALVRLGRSGEALSPLTRAIELRPGYARAHSNLGAALYSLGRYEEAWREVELARRHGFEPPADLLRMLSEKMPEPGRPETSR